MLDLRNVHQDFWDVQTGSTDGSCTPQVRSQKQTREDHPKCGVRQPLMVLVDVDLCGECLKESDKYLLKWARLRKGPVQLCCREMKIRGSHVYIVMEILKILDRDCIQELEVNSWWQQESLCKLLLLIYKTVFNGDHALPEMKKCVSEPVPQIFYINCLQHLYMNDIHFLKGNLSMLLR